MADSIGLAGRLFIGGVLSCVLFVGLVQVPDPAIFGIREEPSRILFYGLSALLAVCSGLLAIGGGTTLALRRHGTGAGRCTAAVLGLVLLAAFAVSLVRRLLPFS